MLYHKYESYQRYLEIRLASTAMNNAQEEVLRRHTIPWYSNMVQSEARNANIAKSDLMGMEINFKWGDLHRMPGHKGKAPKKPKPYTKRTKAPGKFARPLTNNPEKALKVKGLSAAFRQLRAQEKQTE